MVSNADNDIVIIKKAGIEVVIRIQPDGYPYAVTAALPTGFPNPQQFLIDTVLEYVRKKGFDVKNCIAHAEAVSSVCGSQNTDDLIKFGDIAEKFKKLVSRKKGFQVNNTWKPFTKL